MTMIEIPLWLLIVMSISTLFVGLLLLYCLVCGVIIMFEKEPKVIETECPYEIEIEEKPNEKI